VLTFFILLQGGEGADEADAVVGDEYQEHEAQVRSLPASFLETLSYLR